MPATRRNDDDLSESLRHDADDGPVVTPGYTVLSKDDWERLLSVVRFVVTTRPNPELVNEFRQVVQQWMDETADQDGRDDLTTLREKLETLSSPRIAEIEDFIDFIRQRDERASEREFAALSESALAKVWDNAEDSIYDAL
jgi:hypothetical protein